MEFLLDLFRHAQWADAEWYRVWGQSTVQDHPDLLRRSGHMIDVMIGFRSMLDGRPPVWTKRERPTYESLKTEAERVHTDFFRFVESLTDADLPQLRVIPFFKNPDLAVTVRDGLTQVAMHSQHHRGQQMTRLKDSGDQPTDVDYIIWLWKGKPAGIWTFA